MAIQDGYEEGHRTDSYDDFRRQEESQYDSTHRGSDRSDEMMDRRCRNDPPPNDRRDPRDYHYDHRYKRQGYDRDRDPRSRDGGSRESDPRDHRQGYEEDRRRADDRRVYDEGRDSRNDSYQSRSMESRSSRGAPYREDLNDSSSSGSLTPESPGSSRDNLSSQASPRLDYPPVSPLQRVPHAHPPSSNSRPPASMRGTPAAAIMQGSHGMSQRALQAMQIERMRVQGPPSTITQSSAASLRPSIPPSVAASRPGSIRFPGPGIHPGASQFGGTSTVDLAGSMVGDEILLHDGNWKLDFNELRYARDSTDVINVIHHASQNEEIEYHAEFKNAHPSGAHHGIICVLKFGKYRVRYTDRSKKIAKRVASAMLLKHYKPDLFSSMLKFHLTSGGASMMGGMTVSKGIGPEGTAAVEEIIKEGGSITVTHTPKTDDYVLFAIPYAELKKRIQQGMIGSEEKWRQILSEFTWRGTNSQPLFRKIKTADSFMGEIIFGDTFRDLRLQLSIRFQTQTLVKCACISVFEVLLDYRQGLIEDVQHQPLEENEKEHVYFLMTDNLALRYAPLGARDLAVRRTARQDINADPSIETYHEDALQVSDLAEACSEEALPFPTYVTTQLSRDNYQCFGSIGDEEDLKSESDECQSILAAMAQCAIRLREKIAQRHIEPDDQVRPLEELDREREFARAKRDRQDDGAQDQEKSRDPYLNNDVADQSYFRQRSANGGDPRHVDDPSGRYPDRPSSRDQNKPQAPRDPYEQPYSRPSSVYHSEGRSRKSSGQPRLGNEIDDRAKRDDRRQRQKPDPRETGREVTPQRNEQEVAREVTPQRTDREGTPHSGPLGQPKAVDTGAQKSLEPVDPETRGRDVWKDRTESDRRSQRSGTDRGNRQSLNSVPEHEDRQGEDRYTPAGDDRRSRGRSERNDYSGAVGDHRDHHYDRGYVRRNYEYREGSERYRQNELSHREERQEPRNYERSVGSERQNDRQMAERRTAHREENRNNYEGHSEQQKEGGRYADSGPSSTNSRRAPRNLMDEEPEPVDSATNAPSKEIQDHSHENERERYSREERHDYDRNDRHRDSGRHRGYSGDRRSQGYESHDRHGYDRRGDYYDRSYTRHDRRGYIDRGRDRDHNRREYDRSPAGRDDRSSIYGAGGRSYAAYSERG